MYKRLILVLVLVSMCGSCGFKDRKGYYYDNHRFNYVKVVPFKDAKDRNINHPYTFTEPQISTILKMIEIKKGRFASKDEDIKTIFDSYSIGKLTPAIVKAFSELTPKQKVAFAFLVKETKLILRNDRLSEGTMWVEDGKLHVDFDVIAAKVTGDIDKRGITAMRQAEKARGLRVALELQAGQEYGSSTKELVIEPGLFAKIADERLQKEKELAEKGVDAELKIEVVKDKSVKQRLKELDILRKERMITEEEYQQKRKEILGNL